MRSLDNFTFFSLVLLTLCTTKPTPTGEETAASTTTTVAARRAHVRVPIQIARTVVLRRPS